MDSRRNFIKKSILLSAALGMPESIKKALAINPATGSTYLDAEHVVILMQENRSFDHCYGTLKGVRGFNDPRAVTLPDGNPVWLQSNSQGKTFLPFRLDIKDSKSVWMGALPHDRASQVDASNNGKHNKWLDSKLSKNESYQHIPLTMGYYTRKDLPFNYALADAFTICDQHFCSAMTSTYPNRLFLWSGTIRERNEGNTKAYIRNGDLDYGGSLWKSFPERLEENDVSWKVYQNDLSCGGGYQGEERSWLTNFGCNPLEYFSQYNVKFSQRYINSLHRQMERLPQEITSLKEKLSGLSKESPEGKKMELTIQRKEKVLSEAVRELEKWSKENYNKLSNRDKELYIKAFTNNSKDTYFNELTTLKVKDGAKEHEVSVPKGDVLYQFREDVNTGKLPTVSWIVPSKNFSEHPSAPFYGNWHVSEILDILTKNPEVWKKTIFIVTYDENDGFFDHIPPFTAPNPKLKNQGKCSKGIDASVEYIQKRDEVGYGTPAKQARTGPIGPGFRVPLIIASPWSRGGQVCSQLFDHTSALQFLEKFLSHKLGRNVSETNISSWRRAVCGDLTSVFRPFEKETEKLTFIKQHEHIAEIYKAQFKGLPAGFRELSANEVLQYRQDLYAFSEMPQQEPGIKPSCALPYELYVDGYLNKSKNLFEIKFLASNQIFGKKSAGAGFKVYDLLKKENQNDVRDTNNRSYAVIAGDQIDDVWELTDNASEKAYHLRVDGPNGFFREFSGNSEDPELKYSVTYEFAKPKQLNGNILLNIEQEGLNKKDYSLKITHHGFVKKSRKEEVFKLSRNQSKQSIRIDLKESYNWYDFTIEIIGFKNYKRRFSGRVETGETGYTDPIMGRVL